MFTLPVVEFIALAVADECGSLSAVGTGRYPSSGGGKQWAARDPGRGSTVGTVEVRGRQQMGVFATLVNRHSFASAVELVAEAGHVCAEHWR
jgi:hypothetical protein